MLLQVPVLLGRLDLPTLPDGEFDYGVAGNYAQAVYSAAVKKDQKAQVAADLSALQGALKNSKVSDYMVDPFIPSAQKLKLLSSTMKMSNISKNMFQVLAENNRMDIAGEISDIFERIMQAEQGFTPVKVTSAVKLNAAQEKEVAAAVKAIVGSGNVEVTTDVNEELLGGLVVSIGDKFTTMQHIDLSTSSKIQKYSALLKQGV